MWTARSRGRCGILAYNATQMAGEARLEIKRTHPGKPHRYPRHSHSRLARLIQEAFGSLFSKIAPCRSFKFLDHTTHLGDRGLTPNQQHFGWEYLGINRDGYILDLRAARRAAPVRAALEGRQ